MTRKSRQGLGGDELLKRLRESATLLRDGGVSLSDALARAQLSSILVLSSSEHLRLKRLTAWLREHLFPGASRNAGMYFGGELSSASSVEHIVSAITSLSLFSTRELVVIYDFEKIKSAAQQALAAALPRKTDSSLLVLCSSSGAAKGPLATALASVATHVEFQQLEGNVLDKWIDREISRVGIASGITVEARAALLQRFGDDLTQLSHELEKLSLLTSSGTPIERSLVETLSRRRADRTSFELVRQIGLRNRVAIMGTVHDLLLQGLHPLQIVAFLSRAWRTMLGRLAPPAGALPGDLANPWFLRQLGPMTSHFSVDRLTRGVALLAKLDFQLKDSKLPANLVLEVAALHLAEPAQPTPWARGEGSLAW